MSISPYFLRELPAGLEPLAELALDLRWTWSHASDALWETLDPQAWAQLKNPYVVLQSLPDERLQELAQDSHFREEVRQVAAAREAYRSRVAWYGEHYAGDALRGIAYFSMEFGLGEGLPLYAGGLGILAGDFLKAASDLGVPVVGVGLLYQEGYFRQSLDNEGWQQEIYPYNDPTSLPVLPVQAPAGGWLRVSTNFPGRRVLFRIWQARIGRVTLYLLDSNDPANSPRDRGITGKLYGGGLELRLVQEIALGVCGWRLIEALGLEIDVCHLNEGHAAFAAVERARRFMERHGVDFREAVWATRAGSVFTTHTPVPAGFDTFPPELILKYSIDYAKALGVDPRELGALGRRNPEDNDEPFNMAYLALRLCAHSNGVSRLHGEVSRRLFRDLYPRWPLRDVPVRHITNGVHVPTWDSPWADVLWTRTVSKERWLGDLTPLAEAIEHLDDEQLWSFRGRERADLVVYARGRLARQLGQRGLDTATVGRARDVLDPNVLTLGFARRFAEYKRPNLLLHDPARLIRLLLDSDRPVQIIVAGKAHPQDDAGKRLIQEWIRLTSRPEIRTHAVFLEDYDMALAQELVQGVDVWINTPRRPWEACGTSGMKVLVNGGLNVSELDGWWAEAYAPAYGWALGNGEEHRETGWDAVEAEQLYRLLEEEIVPAFYDRDAAGIPRAWVARMRVSMAHLTRRYSTNRMMREYVETIYLPAAAILRQRVADGGRLARSMRHWELELTHHWPNIHFGQLVLAPQPDGWSFDLQVYLGDIAAEFVQVQLYADAVDGDDARCETMERGQPIPGAVNGFVYHLAVRTRRPAEDFTARIIPYHPQACIPGELGLITWQR
jgi:starch phosphorylase